MSDPRVAGWALGVVLALGLAPCQAGADGGPPVAVTLARFVCGEGDGHKPEAAPLLWTMRRRAAAHGLPLVAMVRAYSAPLRGYGGARGRWVRALPLLPTPGYRVSWELCLDAARSFLAGTLPDPCAAPTTHFGSVADVAARWPNAELVDCGGARNQYFAERQIAPRGRADLAPCSSAPVVKGASR